MKQVARTAFETALLDLERGIATLPGSPKDMDFHPLRRQMCVCMRTATSIPMAEKSSLKDHIEAVLTQGRALRDVAVVLVRAIPIQGLLPSDGSMTPVRKSIISIIARGLPDTAKRFRLSEKQQSYEAFSIAERMHEDILRPLDILKRIPEDAALIASSRQDILRGIGDILGREYLQPYGYHNLRSTADMLLSKLATLLTTQDASYSEKMEELKALIRETQAWTEANQSFLTSDYYATFLSALRASLVNLDAATRDRFDCDLIPQRREPNLVEKRYPLYQIDRTVTVTIPAINKGPGVALDVVAELTSLSQDVVFESELRLGGVRAGDFALSFPLIVIQPCKTARLEVNISWGIAGTTARNSAKWHTDIVTQDSNIQWKTLETAEPYSGLPPNSRTLP